MHACLDYKVVVLLHAFYNNKLCLKRLAILAFMCAFLGVDNAQRGHCDEVSSKNSGKANQIQNVTACEEAIDGIKFGSLLQHKKVTQFEASQK